MRGCGNARCKSRIGSSRSLTDNGWDMRFLQSERAAVEGLCNDDQLRQEM